MYKCKQCGRILTEYDVFFYKKLAPAAELSEYKCFDCATSYEERTLLQQYLYYRVKNVFLLYLLPILINVSAILATINYLNYRTETLKIIMWISIVCVLLLNALYVLFGGYFDSNADYIVTDNGGGYSIYHNDISASIVILMILFAAIFYVPMAIFKIFKILFRRINIVTKVKRNILPIVVSAYKKAEKEVDLFKITKKDKKKLDLYLAKVNHILCQGYSKLKDMIVRKKLKPVKVVNRKRESFFLVGKGCEWGTDTWILISTDRSKVIVVVGGYKIYTDTKEEVEWTEEYAGLLFQKTGGFYQTPSQTSSRISLGTEEVVKIYTSH